MIFFSFSGTASKRGADIPRGFNKIWFQALQALRACVADEYRARCKVCRTAI